MKFIAVTILALTAMTANALPSVVKRQVAATIDDTTILNFALTLEHLENAFYSGGLAQFDEGAFEAAGLPPFARGRFIAIAANEATHVAFLTSALGENATQPCNYSFPYTDPKSFAALSQVLEGVGVSAYAGAAQFLSDKSHLTAAAVILSTEARQAAWVASSVNKIEPWSGPFDVPLDMNQAFSLAAPLITSCPPSNPVLPVQAFPALTVNLTTHTPGSTGTVAYNGSSSASDAFIAFYTGLNTVFAPVSAGQFTVPEGLNGTVYAVISSNGTVATDATTLAGPAVLQFNFNSQGVIDN